MKYQIQAEEDSSFTLSKGEQAPVENSLPEETVVEETTPEPAPYVPPCVGKKPTSQGLPSQVKGPGGWFEGTSWGR